VASILFGMIPVLKHGGPQLEPRFARVAGLSVKVAIATARATCWSWCSALALVLLISSGLMIRTFQALRQVEPGFTRAQEIQTLRFPFPNPTSKMRRRSCGWSRTSAIELRPFPA
jgi:hypothetical protein